MCMCVRGFVRACVYDCKSVCIRACVCACECVWVCEYVCVRMRSCVCWGEKGERNGKSKKNGEERVVMGFCQRRASHAKPGVYIMLRCSFWFGSPGGGGGWVGGSMLVRERRV